MVVVLDKYKRPAGFCTPKRANILLRKKRAVVHKIYPFTIRIKDIDVRSFKQPEYQVKVDPGSKHTGIAVVEQSTNRVCLFMQIEHRGNQITSALQTRSGSRRDRRQRETRYRRCKWNTNYQKKGSKYKADCPRPDGWLPPSVKSIADNIINWIIKLSKTINVTKVSIEGVKFDTQLMDNLNISGVEYQQGTLFGYEVKEYLLQKYGHTCQYCGGKSGDSVLEVEHIVSRHNGGTNTAKNLTIACACCNAEKGSRNLDEWLDTLKTSKQSELTKARINRIECFLAGHPLVKKNYSAWVNSYRKYLVRSICCLPNISADNVKVASGGRTKFNREQLRLPKDHHIDALCVGEVPCAGYSKLQQPILYIKAQGRGNRLRGNTNACGIITTKYTNRRKSAYSFQSGDIVSVNAVRGKYSGKYVGRVTIRKSGSFVIQTKDKKIPCVSYKHCTLIQRNDGYNYKI